MTQSKDTGFVKNEQGSLLDDETFLGQILGSYLQHFLEREMASFLGAEAYARTDSRRGYRNGYRPRTLKTRVGRLELLVPQDRDGEFHTELFSRYQRNEKALGRP